MVPADAQNSAIAGAIPPKWEKTCDQAETPSKISRRNTL